MYRRHFITSAAGILLATMAFAAIRNRTVASLDGLGQRVVNQFNDKLMGIGTMDAIESLKVTSPAALPDDQVWVLSASSMEQLFSSIDEGIAPPFSNPHAVIGFMPFEFESEPRIKACKSLIQHWSAKGIKVIPVNCQSIGDELGAEASVVDVLEAGEIWAAHRLKDLLSGKNFNYPTTKAIHPRCACNRDGGVT